MYERWRGCVCGSVQPPRLKTDNFFLRDFNRATTPSNTLKYHFYLPSHILLCYPLSFHLNHVFPKPFQFSLNNALTSHTDSNNFLQTCGLSLHLLLHLFLSPWVTEIVSQLSTKQTSLLLFLYNPHSASWAWLRTGFVQKILQPQLTSLTIYLSLTPHVKLAGVETIGNNQPTLPYAITTHLNLMRLL